MLTWKWRLHEFDVGFSVTFYASTTSTSSDGPGAAKSGSTIRVVEYARASQSEGEWRCEVAGTVLFVWDNSFSVLRGKNLSYNVALHESG